MSEYCLQKKRCVISMRIFRGCVLVSVSMCLCVSASVCLYTCIQQTKIWLKQTQSLPSDKEQKQTKNDSNKSKPGQKDDKKGNMRHLPKQ